MKTLTLAITAIAAGLISIVPAAAQYPERPVTLIVPYDPGGATDLQARMLMPFLAEHLGVQVIIENRGGAGTIIGATAVANAAPDGYTIGKLVFPTSYGHIITGDATYTLDSFTPLVNQWVGRSCLCVAANGEYETLDEFVTAAQAGNVNVGVATLSSAAYFASRLLELEAGYSATHVPFDGGAATITAILGGHIPAGSVAASEVLEQVRGGTLRVLAMLSDTRWEELPDVPTALELGYDAAFDSMGGYAAPAGLPDDVLATLVAAFEAALTDPDYLAVAEQNSLQALPMTHEEFTAYLPGAFEQLNEVIQVDLEASAQ